MPGSRAARLPADVQDDLVEIGRGLVKAIEPEELAIFDDVAAEYIADPTEALRVRRHDETVGFGLELMVSTPAVLQVLSTSAQWLGQAVVGAGVAEALTFGIRYLRKCRDKPDELAEPTLSPEQISDFRQSTIQYATTLGLTREKAVLLADQLLDPAETALSSGSD